MDLLQTRPINLFQYNAGWLLLQRTITKRCFLSFQVHLSFERNYINYHLLFLLWFERFWNIVQIEITFRTSQSLFVKIEFLTYTIIFLYFVKKNVTLVWLINLHAYVHSLRFGFFWTFLLSSNVAKTYLSIPWEIDSVVGCTLEIIHLLPVCKGKAKMLKMKPSFLIFSIRLNIRTIYLKLVLNTHI